MYKRDRRSYTEVHQGAVKKRISERVFLQGLTTDGRSDLSSISSVAQRAPTLGGLLFAG